MPLPHSQDWIGRYAGVLALVLLALLSACPKSKPSATSPGQPPSQPAAQSSQPPVAGAAGDSAAQGAASQPATTGADAANPLPQGVNWVWASKLSFRIGETIQVRYALQQTADTKPWIGLIPASVTATDEASNDAADITYKYAETATGTLELSAAGIGEFRIKLLSGDDGGSVLAETPLLTITQWPQGDLAAMKPPYVTLSGGKLPDKVELKLGYVIAAYWEVPEVYPNTAWIGLIPTTCTSLAEGDNDAADVAYEYLSGATKKDSAFTLEQAGEFVFRIFPCDNPLAEAVAESQAFYVK